MLYSIFKQVPFAINYVKSFNNLQNVLGIRTVYPAIHLVKKSKLLKSSFTALNYSLGKLVSVSTIHPLKIESKKMEDITELASLSKEQESSKSEVKSRIDFDMEFSESENETSSEEIDESVPVEKVPYKENYYQHSFSISRNYYKHIVGSNGIILRRLCTDTKTIIRVSKKKKHVGSVQKRIIRAKHKIAKIIEDSKTKLRFTHFISIPTNTNEIKNNFLKFKNDVIENCDLESTGFHEGMFQKPEKLHLTICMLHLTDEEAEEKAIDALNYCKEQIIKPLLTKTGPLNIEFKGLKFMGSSINKTRVVYIKVHEKTGSLKKIADKINDYFIEQGLSRRERNDVTLHMTVMNTFYLTRKKHKDAKNTFDASNIFKNCGETYLGEINLSTFHLSQLTAKSADGYFKATAKICF